MKHKHCEVIKAWADGETIQFWSQLTDKWMDVAGDPEWSICDKYRVKPEIAEFRLAKVRAESGRECVNLCSSRENGKAFERKPIFIKWLTDWQEVEV